MRFTLLNRIDEAGDCYEQAVRLRPDWPEAFYNLGVTRMRQNRLEDAVVAYQSALRSRPDYPEVFNNLGNVLLAQGQVEEATSHYERALALQPEYLDARYNLGIALQKWDRLEEALVSYQEVLRQKPDHSEALNNLGNTLLALGRPREALLRYREALDHQPDHAEAQWNLGLAQLLLGDFRPGWEGYEWRFRQKEASPRQFKQPLWEGSPLRGRSILLHAEQGLGDTLQFVRYAPGVKQAGGKVLVECQPALQALLTSARGIDHVFAKDTSLPHFDCHLPLMSLPRVFGTTLETIPAQAPYLHADPKLILEWRERIGAGGLFKIALVWAGNLRHKNDRQRSIPLQLFGRLSALPGVRFFSLQKGPQAAEALHPPPGLHIISLESELHDFSQTAGAIANLDLVISVDTAVAHLAGALVKPVWTLLPFAPDWRWLLGRADSPWYPTMRLFRQPRQGDWASVLDEVGGELNALVS